MTRTIIDINILQTLPPSNLNRDDTGSPKTAFYGGVRRARVSSQAWKRATRLAFNQTLDPSLVGTRTKRVVELLADRIHERDSAISTEKALGLATLALEAAGVKLSAPRGSSKENPLPAESGFLMFLSARQIDQLTDAALDAKETADIPGALKAAGLKKKLDTEHSVDMSLFGRMVADAPDLNVDAAVQVAHALSVHAVENEFDYFTAVDDHKDADEDEDAGAGMIGTVEFNSSTLYRYATIDVDRLQRNLGNVDATRIAVRAFVEAFATSMPTGKQNTFGNRTLPDAIIVSIRERQPVNLVGAFEEAIQTERLRTASERLVAHAREIDGNFGTTPVASWVVRVGAATESLDALGEKVSLPALLDQLEPLVAARLSVSA